MTLDLHLRLTPTSCLTHSHLTKKNTFTHCRFVFLSFGQKHLTYALVNSVIALECTSSRFVTGYESNHSVVKRKSWKAAKMNDDDWKGYIEIIDNVKKWQNQRKSAEKQQDDGQRLLRPREENNAAKLRSSENKKKQTEGGREEGSAYPILLCMNFIRRFTTANRKRKGGGLTRGGERWRQTSGMTCLHKKEKEIRNLNYCGTRMALWHQFSWQPENSVACMPARCANASSAADEGRREENKGGWKKKIVTVQQCSGKGNKQRGRKYGGTKNRENMSEAKHELLCQQAKKNDIQTKD